MGVIRGVLAPKRSRFVSVLLFVDFLNLKMILFDTIIVSFVELFQDGKRCSGHP